MRSLLAVLAALSVLSLGGCLAASAAGTAVGVAGKAAGAGVRATGAVAGAVIP
jgi:hypothetical protein